VFSRGVNFWGVLFLPLFSRKERRSHGRDRTHANASGEAKSQQHRYGNLWTALPNVNVGGHLASNLFIAVARKQVLSDFVGKRDAEQNAPKSIPVHVDGDAHVEASMAPLRHVGELAVSELHVQVLCHTAKDLILILEE
jgi:hypothetical protein